MRVSGVLAVNSALKDGNLHTHSLSEYSFTLLPAVAIQARSSCNKTPTGARAINRWAAIKPFSQVCMVKVVENSKSPLIRS